jgi:23S rRNA (pseudouridine1915-N3)-methyltransferase
MRLWIVAVGVRLPDWAEAACADYLRRFPPDLKVELRTVKAEARTSGKTAAQMMAAEALRIEAALPRGARRIVLDERGARLTSHQLADRVEVWKRDGRDAALLIGGPDGLAAEFAARADETLRLSDLTLPHALARVVLAEALYRAWSLNAGHPYHRE